MFLSYAKPILNDAKGRCHDVGAPIQCDDVVDDFLFRLQVEGGAGGVCHIRVMMSFIARYQKRGKEMFISITLRCDSRRMNFEASRIGGHRSVEPVDAVARRIAFGAIKALGNSGGDRSRGARAKRSAARLILPEVWRCAEQSVALPYFYCVINYTRKRQHKGQQGRCCTMDRAIWMRSVAIDRGLCRCARALRPSRPEAGRYWGAA